MTLNAPIAALRRLTVQGAKPDSLEICDFCSAFLFPHHRHLLEVASRKIICVCDPCALRFDSAIDGRFRLIPRESRELPNFRLNDAEWDNLALPINLIFIFHNTLSGKPTAIYPSPAGPTESLIGLETWQRILAENCELDELKPDVEALLINRLGKARDYFIVPIDACFELVGLIRKNWRGLSGGEKVRVEIETFFNRLREPSVRLATRNLKEEAYA